MRVLNIKHGMNALVWVLSIAYPFVWYVGQRYVDMVYIAAFMAVVWGVRSLMEKVALRKGLYFVIAAFFVVVAIGQFQETMYWYPVMVSVLMLIFFAGSLFTKQSIIERLARIQHPNLPETGVQYTRQVTRIWCVFFLLNIAITVSLIVGEYWQAWTVYTGIVSYVLMGILFAAEWLYRRLVLKISP